MPVRALSSMTNLESVGGAREDTCALVFFSHLPLSGGDRGTFRFPSRLKCGSVDLLPFSFRLA